MFEIMYKKIQVRILNKNIHTKYFSDNAVTLACNIWVHTFSIKKLYLIHIIAEVRPDFPIEEKGMNIIATGMSQTKRQRKCESLQRSAQPYLVFSAANTTRLYVSLESPAFVVLFSLAGIRLISFHQ